MTRYKGRTSQKVIEREFPYIVEIAVPPLGLGARLDVMHHFHHARGTKACLGLGRRHEGRDYLRWYFARPTIAMDFAEAFGGAVINNAPR
jgi:hypothetical protein